MSSQGQDSGKIMLFTNDLYKDHFYPGKRFATTIKHYSKVLENSGAWSEKCLNTSWLPYTVLIKGSAASVPCFSGLKVGLLICACLEQRFNR